MFQPLFCVSTPLGVELPASPDMRSQRHLLTPRVFQNEIRLWPPKRKPQFIAPASCLLPHGALHVTECSPIQNGTLALQSATRPSAEIPLRQLRRRRVTASNARALWVPLNLHNLHVVPYIVSLRPRLGVMEVQKTRGTPPHAQTASADRKYLACSFPVWSRGSGQEPQVMGGRCL